MTVTKESGRVLVRHDEANEGNRSLEYFVRDYNAGFDEILNDCRSVIITGSSLKPIDQLKLRLFAKTGVKSDDVRHYSWAHISPTRNLLAFAIDSVDALGNETLRFDIVNRYNMVSSLVKLLWKFGTDKIERGRAMYKLHGGIVVFFTSFEYMNWVVDRTQAICFGRPLFVEPQESEKIQETLEQYTNAINQNSVLGAMLFCVMGGKICEDFDFKGDFGRLLILFGLPYPDQNLIEYEEMYAYVEESEGLVAAQNMGLFMCMKIVNQCIGSAIRHKEDYAAVLLADECYKDERVWKLLPDWIQSQIKFDNAESAYGIVANFFATLRTDRIEEDVGIL